MKRRCLSPSHPQYHRYGGRGITICDEWLSFSAFRSWAIKNGVSRTLTIDRKDNDKGYGPSNCRWATQQEQARNTSRNVCIEFNGETKLLVDWAKSIGLHPSQLGRRIKKVGAEKALTTPRIPRKERSVRRRLPNSEKMGS